MVGVLCFGCQSDYTKLVKEELSKGVRYDSILLGIHLNDTRDEFYGKCYDLNKAQLISDGGSGFVHYILKDSVVHKSPEEINVLFRPNFDNKNHMAEMLVHLSYPGWASGLPRYSSDSLGVRTIQLLEHLYGGNKFVAAHVGEEEIPVKVDGNRRIFLEKLDGQTVQLKIQDILHPIFQHSITRESLKEKKQ
jgi:hypothetical protein